MGNVGNTFAVYTLHFNDDQRYIVWYDNNITLKQDHSIYMHNIFCESYGVFYVTFM